MILLLLTYTIIIKKPPLVGGLLNRTDLLCVRAKLDTPAEEYKVDIRQSSALPTLQSIPLSEAYRAQLGGGPGGTRTLDPLLAKQVL